MPAPDQEFTIANVISVTRKVAIHGFPDFPHGGTLVLLEPPFEVSGRELSRYIAEVTTEPEKSVRLRYEHWHMNDEKVIGLLFKKADPLMIPPGSKVRFVKR
jgi:hypothetical protein